MGELKKYKVIAYSVGGMNNKVYRSGDTVCESNFPPGNAEILEEKDFLKSLSKSDLKKLADKDKKDAAKVEQERVDVLNVKISNSEKVLEEANVALEIAKEDHKLNLDSVESAEDEESKNAAELKVVETQAVLDDAESMVERATGNVDDLKSQL